MPVSQRTMPVAQLEDPSGNSKCDKDLVLLIGLPFSLSLPASKEFPKKSHTETAVQTAPTPQDRWKLSPQGRKVFWSGQEVCESSWMCEEQVISGCFPSFCLTAWSSREDNRQATTVALFKNRSMSA